jgi:proline dehydrogenase
MRNCAARQFRTLRLDSTVAHRCGPSSTRFTARMNHAYHRLVADISQRYGVSIDSIDGRVASRRRRTHGLLGPMLAARSVGASLALGAVEERFGRHIAAGARHISGLTEEEAIEAARSDAGSGRASTLGYWSTPGEAATSIARHYIRAIEAVAAAGVPASVSIKADLLDFDRGVVAAVLREATHCGVRVHFDGQGYDTVERTHDLVEDAVMSGADVSATLASRFRRSLTDADRLVRLRVPVRVVKGQGGDPNYPKIDPRTSFLELTECLAGRAAEVGVATHDRRSAEPALDRLVRAGTQCVLEQLRSLPRIDFIADQRRLPVRVYIAYGHAGLPYAIGEVMRRPAMVAWILRDLVLRHAKPSQPPESRS